MILDEQFDDLKGWLDAGERVILEKFEADLLKGIEETSKRLLAKVWDLKVTQEIDKKDFAKLMAKYEPSAEKVVMYQVWKILEENRDTEDVGAVRAHLIDHLKTKCNAKKVKQSYCFAEVCFNHNYHIP